CRRLKEILRWLAIWAGAPLATFGVSVSATRCSASHLPFRGLGARRNFPPLFLSVCWFSLTFSRLIRGGTRLAFLLDSAANRTWDRAGAAQAHGFFSSQSFWKAGSERNGSHVGSSLRSAGVRKLPYGVSKRCCSLGIARFLSPTKTSTKAKFSSFLGPSTASFPLGSSVIARSASFIAASFWPSTARVTERTWAKFGLSGSFWQSVSREPSIC